MTISNYPDKDETARCQLHTLAFYLNQDKWRDKNGNDKKSLDP